MFYLRSLIIFALLLLVANPATAEEDPRPGVLDALELELQRSVSGLKIEDFEAPYFMAYGMKDTRYVVLNGKYGALDTTDASRNRQAYVEIRVGDYQFDNFANIDGEPTRYSEMLVSSQVPLDDDPLAIRQTFWLLSDELYKEAMGAFLAKKGSRVFAHEDTTKIPSFSKTTIATHVAPELALALPQEEWEETIRVVSKDIAASEGVVDSNVRVTAERTTRYFVTSEGTKLIDEHVIYGVFISAFARADDGMLLDNGLTYYARTPEALPTRDQLVADSAEMVAQLQALRDAEPIEPFIGPAILAPEAAGVLFHEAIGHRLEGERQIDDEEGQTFKGQVGNLIVADFLTVKDDPRVDTLNGVELNGHYDYDDEGVASNEALLVENGTLKGFLLSRAPVAEDDVSNGHGRAQANFKPMARMGNLMIEADKKSSFSDAKLKAMLLEEVRQQGKPFGLYIKDITGGSTNTSGYGYQAFKGAPRLVYKVDAETGKETLVRGVELVGTPLAAVSKIVAAGETRGIFNGYCGAESGYVPVSTVAPAVLLSEMEFQRVQGQKDKDTILPPPMVEDATKAESE